MNKSILKWNQVCQLHWKTQFRESILNTSMLWQCLLSAWQSLLQIQSHFVVPLRVRSHMRFGSSDFAERCDFNRNAPIFSNHHRWQQQQHVMFSRLCKCHFKSDLGIQQTQLWMSLKISIIFFGTARFRSNQFIQFCQFFETANLLQNYHWPSL